LKIILVDWSLDRSFQQQFSSCVSGDSLDAKRVLTWEDRVAPDTMRCQRERRRLHQALDRCLCRGVMRLLYASEKGRDTGNGDDRPTPMFSLLLGHLIGDRSCDEKGSMKVDLLGLEKELIRHVQEGVEGTDSSIRYEDIDPTVRLDSFLDNLWGKMCISDIPCKVCVDGCFELADADVSTCEMSPATVMARRPAASTASRTFMTSGSVSLPR
jgi:hypothetical protein